MRQLSKELYEVKALNEEQWEVTLAKETHPVFKAHFEGNPLLPAFLQIDIFAEIINRQVTKIERCKFKAPILPNETVLYEVVKKVDKRYQVNIKKENVICSELKIELN